MCFFEPKVISTTFSCPFSTATKPHKSVRSFLSILYRNFGFFSMNAHIADFFPSSSPHMKVQKSLLCMSGWWAYTKAPRALYKRSLLIVVCSLIRSGRKRRRTVKSCRRQWYYFVRLRCFLIIFCFSRFNYANCGSRRSENEAFYRLRPRRRARNLWLVATTSQIVAAC